MLKWRRKIGLGILIGTLFCLAGFAQDEPNQTHSLLFKIRDKENFPISGVTVAIYTKSDNKIIQTSTTGKTGDLSFVVKLFNDYLVVIKKKGYLPKKIILNSQPPEKKRNFKLAYKNDIVVKLFNSPDPEAGADLLDLPFLRYTYGTNSDGKGEIDVDSNYSKSIRKRINALTPKEREEAFNQIVNEGPTITIAPKGPGNGTKQDGTKQDGSKVELAKSDPPKASAGKEYTNLISSGDQLMKDKKIVEAKEKFGLALRLKPTEKYPADQLKKLNGIIEKDNKLQKEQDNLFAKDLRSGENAMSQKDYKAAKKAFAAATVLKPNAPELKGKLQKASEALKAQLKELEEKYTKAIAEADEDFNKKKYKKAKEAYQEAQKIKPEESYATGKVEEIEKIENEELAKKEKSYITAIEQGDKAFGEKDYEKAKSAFTKARQLKKEESYPQKKLKEIDQLLKEMQASINDIVQLGPGQSNEIANKEKANQLNSLREAQLDKIEQLKKIRQAYLQKMQNNTTKYSTVNPMTRLLDIVDNQKP